MNIISYYFENEMLSPFGNAVLLLLLVIFVPFILIASIYNIIMIIRPFLREREYIKMEMKRSFDEDEYRYWKHRLKKLYLRSIPFIGKFF